MIPRKRLKTGECVVRVIKRNVRKGYVRVKLIPPNKDFRSSLLDRADENGYVVLKAEEYQRMVNPLFSRRP